MGRVVMKTNGVGSFSCKYAPADALVHLCNGSGRRYKPRYHGTHQLVVSKLLCTACQKSHEQHSTCSVPQNVEGLQIMQTNNTVLHMCSSNCTAATSVLYTIRHERGTIQTANTVRHALLVQDGAQATCGVEGVGGLDTWLGTLARSHGSTRAHCSKPSGVLKCHKQRENMKRKKST